MDPNPLIMKSYGKKFTSLEFLIGFTFVYFFACWSAPVSAQELLLTETFEAVTIPADWYEAHEGSSFSNHWQISETGNAGSIPNELWCQGTSATGTSRMVLPPINAQFLSSLSINFNSYFEDIGPGANLKIQSSNDGITWYDEAWWFTSGGGSAGPELISIPLTVFSGSTDYIAFVVDGDLSAFSGWFIDQVEIWGTVNYLACPTLLQPGNAFSDISLNPVLSWDYSENAYGYRIHVGTDYPPTNLINGLDIGFTNSFHVQNLDPAQVYYWAINPYHPNMISPGCPVQSFETTESYALPFTENFANPEFPTAWSQFSYQPNDLWSLSQTNYGGGAVNELLLTFAADIGVTRLYMPPVQSSGVSEMFLSFKHSFVDFAPGLTFKIQTSSDMVTWHDAGWQFLSGNGSVSAETVTIPITQDLGDITYLAFTSEGDHNNFYYWAIDDIELTLSIPGPACTEAVSPEPGTIGIINPLIIRWHSVPGADEYLLYLGTDNPPSNLIDGLSLLDTVSGSIQNLTQNTVYFWKVIPVNENGQAAGCPVWSFTTAGTISEFPWTENFDLNFDIPAGWAMSGEESWVIRSFSAWGPYHDHTSGTGRYALLDDSLPNQTLSSELITPEFDITTLNHPKCIFWYQVGTLNSYWSESELLIDIWYNGDWVLDVNPTLKRHGVWKQVILDLTPFMSSACKIRFRGVEDPLYMDSDIAIDDVSIKDTVVIIPCPDLNYPIVTDTMVSKSGLFSWDESPNTNGYLFYLGTDNPPTNLVNGQNTGFETNFDFTVPDYNTLYYWSVSGYNSDDTLSCSVRSFKTRPDPYRSLPYIETCSYVLNNLLPPDWWDYTSNTDIFWTVGNTNYAGGDSMEFTAECFFPDQAGYAYLTSPPVNISGITELQLSFKHNFITSGNADGMLTLLTTTDYITWQTSWTYNMALGTTGPEEVLLTLDSLSGDSLYISFIMSGSNIVFDNWYLDDISFSEVPSGNGSVGGNLFYGESGTVPIAFCEIKLMSGAVLVDSTLSAANGSFAFTNVPPGTYTLEANSTLPWGGGNAVDALLIMKHFVGMAPLTGLKLLAADVDNSGFANSVDAMSVMKRFVGMQTSFPHGDWAFNQSAITIPPGTTITPTLRGLCYGDLDATYVPPIIMGIPCPGIPTVLYEGITYETVKIGTQCWFKQNLNVGNPINGTEMPSNNAVIEKYCYNNDLQNCDVYGGLYNWSEAMQYSVTPGTQGICPPGFHVPSQPDIETLITFLGGLQVAGGKLKETGNTHWNNYIYHSATNLSGFTALPGGRRDNLGFYFHSLHDAASFWSSSTYGNEDAWAFHTYFSVNYVTNFFGNRSQAAFSIRCIKNP